MRDEVHVVARGWVRWGGVLVKGEGASGWTMMRVGLRARTGCQQPLFSMRPRRDLANELFRVGDMPD